MVNVLGFYLGDYFAVVLLRRYGGHVGIFGEENDKLAFCKRKHRVGLVTVNLHIALFVVVFHHFVAVGSCAPSHLLCTIDYQLYVYIVAVGFQVAVFLLLTRHIGYSDVDVITLKFDFTGRQFLKVVVKEELEGLLQAFGTIEITIGVF